MSSLLAKSLTFIILATAVGLLALDIKDHGSFKASRTYRFLEDSGALHYGAVAWAKFRTYSQQGYKWCQINVPVYMTKVRESAAPLVRSALDYLSYLVQLLLTNVQLIYKYFLEKKPLIEQWVNKYVPGLMETASSWFWQTWTFVRNSILVLLEILLKYLSVAAKWLKEDVFIGSLSPENLQRYTIHALNTTTQLASQTISWLNDKVVTVMSAS